MTTMSQLRIASIPSMYFQVEATHKVPPAAPEGSGVAQPALEVSECGLDEAAEWFGSEWHALLASEGLNITLAPEFLTAASASVGLRDRQRVMVARRGAQLVGVLPFFVKVFRLHGVPMRMLCLGTNLIAYHPEIPAPACAAELLDAVLSSRSHPWDVFCARAVPSDGLTTRAVRQVASARGYAMVSYPGEASPFLAQSWDEFLRSKSSNFRYNLKRKEKTLKSGGAITERWLTSEADVPALLRCMQEIESSSWKSAADVAVTSKRSELGYYEAVIPFLARHGMLFANAIYLDDEPIAYHLCYRFIGVVGNMKTSFKESHSALSPGAAVIKSAIQRSFELGAREFDFLGETQYHKLLWTDTVRKHDVHFLYSRTVRGRLFGAIKRATERWRRTNFHHVIRRAEVTAKKD